MQRNERSLVRGALWFASIALGASAAAQVPIVVATTPAEDTAAAVADRNWKVPRTSWGHPNLEGVYSTDDMRSVPRDRPEEIGTREKLTPEEFAEARARTMPNERDRVLNKSSYSSNSVGSRTFGWTSQVIDPPNGRMPPLNADGAGARAAERSRLVRRRDRSTRSRISICTTAASLAASWARRSPWSTATASASRRVPTAWSSATRCWPTRA